MNIFTDQPLTSSSGKYHIPYLLAVCTLLLLTLFSIIFYRERMFFVDPCWVTFKIINTKTFSIPEYRYGSFITQIYPLVGVYLGLSVKSLLILYSVSFYIFYLGTVLIAGMVWKQKWLGVLLALYFTLFVSDVYFWPNNEVHQGVTWMILFLSLYIHTLGRRIHPAVHVVLVLFAFLAISSHLLVMLPLTLLWLYYHIEKHQGLRALLRDKRSMVYSLILVVFIVIRYLLSTQGWYDGAKLEGVKSISVKSLVASFSSGQSRSFLQLLAGNYWIALLLFLAGFLYLLRARKYIQLLLVTGFVLAYYALICITYPDAFGRPVLFYMESEWMALSLILVIPFVIHIVPRISSQKVVLILFLVIFATRLGYIAQAYPYFLGRFNQLDRMTSSLQEEGTHNALFIMDKKTADSLFIMDWGLPIESMMLSKTKGYNIPTTFKGVDTAFKIRPVKDSFYSCFSVDAISSLDKRYFKLDTVQGYKVYKR